jgi:Tfp pilus assembly protein PilN
VTFFALNLATRPLRNNVVFWLTFGACFVLLAGFSWYNLHQYRATGDEMAGRADSLRSQQEEFARLNGEVGSMTQNVNKLDLKALNERSLFANGIILSRLFSWSDLFDRLEKVQPETVRLRSIRPVISKEGTEVNIDALTKDYDSLLRFEASLLDSDYFSFVYPLQESTKESPGGGEIHFNLAFGYVPEGKKGAGKPARPAPGAGAEAPQDPNAPPAADPDAPAADPNEEEAGTESGR